MTEQQAIPGPSWGNVVRSPKGNNRLYDPANFYVRATDARGHSEEVHVKVPPDIYAEIGRLAGSPDYPEYDTMGDVIRDALVHHVARRQKEGVDPARREAIDRIARDHALWDNLDKITARVARRQATLDSFRSALVAAEKAGRWPEVESIVNDAEFYASLADEPDATILWDMAKEWKAKIPGGGVGQ